MRGLAVALVVLTCGHALSNAMRTLPAIATDLLAHDLGVSDESIASITGLFHFAFALGQIPVGVALDRFGVRPVAMVLITIASIGALMAAMATGPWSMAAAQIVMGFGFSGMLIAPMTFASSSMAAAQFGLWSGLILGLGNTGMLISASPLAWLVEVAGWRAGFYAGAAFGVLVLVLEFLFVHSVRPTPHPDRTLLGDARGVVHLLCSRTLRAPVVLAFVSLAGIIGVRGLWGGPWLMDIKHLSRIEAGNILLLLTFALIAGPALTGIADRRFGNRRALVVGGHVLAGVLLFVLLACAELPVYVDAGLLLVYGFGVATQPLLFAIARTETKPEETGRALAAVNLSFFAGTALLLPVSGVVAGFAGVAGAIAALAIALLAGAVCFWRLTVPRSTP